MTPRDTLVEHFRELERLFAILFAEPSSQFVDEGRDFTKEFFEHGEYGLALETFVDTVMETKREISPLAFETIKSLATAMEIRDLDLAALEKLVTQ